MQNHLCRVTVFLNIHDYLNFDNLWIVEVETCQPTSTILFHRIRDADMPPSHLDWWICILYLHMWALSSLGFGPNGGPLNAREAQNVPVGLRANIVGPV